MSKDNGKSNEETKIRVIKDESESKTTDKSFVKSKQKKVKEGKEKKQRHLPKPIRVLLSPFFAIGRYFRNSWRELKQVRWPNRKTTWKMTIAVIVYTVIFFLFIMVLDALFTFIFSKVLG